MTSVSSQPNRSQGSWRAPASALGIALAFACLLAVPREGRATVTATAGSGLTKVKTTSTGIYLLANLKGSTTQGEHLALFHKGVMVEAHVRKKFSGTYYRRLSGSDPVRKSITTFNTLLSIAPIDVDVETLPATTRSRYYTAAGFSTTSSPTTVPPDNNGGCPSGYELRRTTTGYECRAISMGPIWNDPRLGYILDGLESLWNGLVPSAEAALQLIYFKFDLSQFFSNIVFIYEAPVGGQAEGWRFQGFGFDIIYGEPASGG